jgi:hypothetical protein
MATVVWRLLCGEDDCIQTLPVLQNLQTGVHQWITLRE